MYITISVKHLNDFIENGKFLSDLKKLTLNSTSGMNKELNALKTKKNSGLSIDAKAIIASEKDQMVGWALFSRETSDCCWSYKFNPGQGILFEVYVNQAYRKLGIASRLIKKAHKMANGSTLCVVPWNDESTRFYRKNKELKIKSLYSYVEL